MRWALSIVAPVEAVIEFLIEQVDYLILRHEGIKRVYVADDAANLLFLLMRRLRHDCVLLCSSAFYHRIA